MGFLTGRLAPILLALVALCAALPCAASALTFEIENESGLAPEQVFVTVAAGGAFDVPGMENDVPVRLSEIPGEKLEIEQLVSGRVYIAYGAGVTEATTLASPTRFDWAELTVTPNSSDVANLTAVDQFGIGMRLDTYDGSDQHLETVGAANSNTIFNALQQIPGGPQATVRDGQGNILRVISPNKSTAYPDLGDYVRSMSGKTITLRTAFFGSPFTTSSYSGTFAADGSIQLAGTTNPAAEAAPQIAISGADLIADIYTGGNTPNNLEGAIYRDLLAGFSVGFWDGRYGNDALSFCTNPITTGQGSWCPAGFDQPAFGDARLSLAPFATCEQYAAVINQYSDVYGNPYSDAAKKVTVSLNQPGSGGEVETLRLTIQPDSGDAMPQQSGNPNCGAAPPAAVIGPPPVAAPKAKTAVKVRFFSRAKVRGRVAKVGRVSCSGPCGRVRALAKRGKAVIAREQGRMAKANGPLKLRLTNKGKRALKRSGRLKVRVVVWVTPVGERPVRKRHAVTLLG